MAATAGSTYQVIALAHQAGNPPNTDYQRASETFAAYQQRMFGAGYIVDINPTESDAAYQARLLTYQPAPVINNVIGQVWGLGINQTSSVYNCSVTHIGTGSYGVTFNNPLQVNQLYIVNTNGYLGSNAAPTASCDFIQGQTNASFTMSVQNQSSIATDWVTGSFQVVSK